MIYSFENNDSCKKNSQVRDMVQLMADAGLIYKKKANIFALCDTREIENLFANNFSCIFDMLDFFAETDPLSVIGSYIREKLYADGTVAEAETPFMYHYLLPTQCLDSEITYTLLRALHEKKMSALPRSINRSSIALPSDFMSAGIRAENSSFTENPESRS